MTRGPRKETRYGVWPTPAVLGYTLSPMAGKGDLYCHHPILIRPALGRLPIKMRGLNRGSPKPQPAVGAAADVNLAVASSEWGAGEGAQKRSQTVVPVATGGLAGKTNLSGHKCLLGSLHMRPTRMALTL